MHTLFKTMTTPSTSESNPATSATTTPSAAAAAPDNDVKMTDTTTANTTDSASITNNQNEEGKNNDNSSQSKKRPAEQDLSTQAPDTKKQKISNGEEKPQTTAENQSSNNDSNNSEDKDNSADTKKDADKKPVHKKQQVCKNEERKKLAPKRKVALVIGYKGTNFHGIQIQNDDVTVEGDLWNALKQTDAVLEANKVHPRKISWSRTSRTDRGVHALVNIIECKLHVYDDLVNELNGLLKNDKGERDIMVHGYSRVTGGFKARTSCDAREYWYLMPTFVFNRKDELFNYTSGPHTGDESIGKDRLDQRMFQISQEELSSKVNKDYRMSQEDVDYVNGIMKQFEGTHYFHNFTKMTKGMKVTQTQRYLTNFSIEQPFFDDQTGLEWTVVHIYGSSFLLNQIRKMIGLVIAICKGKMERSVLDTVFDKKDETYIPRIPGHGLMLKDMKFRAYNSFKGDIHGQIHPYDDFQDNIQIFKKELFRHIMQMETDNQEWQRWTFLLDKIIKTLRDPIDFDKASQRLENQNLSAEIEIDVPIEKAWSHVGDFAKLPTSIENFISVEFLEDKSPAESGATRVVKLAAEGNYNKPKVKRHILKSIDNENHLIEYTSIKLKKYTESSTVNETLQLSKISGDKTKLYWKTFIDIGTEKFVKSETDRIQKRVQEIKEYLEKEENKMQVEEKQTDSSATATATAEPVAAATSNAETTEPEK